MGIEIERKFLVHGEPWKVFSVVGTQFTQGYLSIERERTVRVRLCGERAYVTIKSPLHGLARNEYEYEIPHDEAKLILDTMVKKPLIEKVRYHIPHDGMVWDVDVFFGENAGLVLAEIELSSEQQTFVKPDWVGQEVTHDARYLNSALVSCPYSTWQMKENHGA